MALMFFSTCSDYGIFYALENEKVIQESNNLKNSTIFTNMIQTDNYYLGSAGPNIWYRSTDDSNSTVDDWHKLALPGDFSSDATVSSMVLVGTELVISMISYDDSNVVSGIYTLTGADAFNYGSTTPTWVEQISSTATKGSTPVSFYRLFAANSNLYVNELSYAYSSPTDDSGDLIDSLLYAAISPVTPSTISGDLGNITSIPISSFAKASDGTTDYTAKVEQIVYGSSTNFWMIINGETDGKIYSSDDGSFMAGHLTDETTTISSSSLDDARYVDIFEADATHILISNTSGSLYILAGTGGSYTELTRGSNYLNGFVDIDIVAGTLKSNTILVGTSAAIGDSTYDGSGYYELNTTTWSWNDTDDNFSELNNYNSSDLSDSTINGFLYDTDNNRLFAYTRNSGVWMNAIDPDNAGQRIWTRE